MILDFIDTYNIETRVKDQTNKILKAILDKDNMIEEVKSLRNKKDRWDSGKPYHQQILFCDIQIKVVISHRQIYVYYTDLLPLKILVTLTFQGHLRLTLIVPLDSPYMVSY